MLEPQTFLIGYTTMDLEGMKAYLKASGNDDFMQALVASMATDVSLGEALCSFYAKLCYSALSLGKNANITRTRDIEANIQACFNQGHGSVFEHCWLNFVTTNCSRVFTHEHVRHRVGTAFSQTSGRYVRLDKINLVDGDPLLEPYIDDFDQLAIGVEEWYAGMVEKTGLNEMKDFGAKKKLTSALRRAIPQGISNEIGWSCNIRSLRHMLMMRTSRHAEWEIRKVFNDVFDIVYERFPLMLHGHKAEMVDGLWEVTGMKLQPYQ